MVPRIRTLWSVLLGVVLFGGTAVADVLHLKKGGRLEGVLVAETATSLTIDVGMGRISVPRSAVQRVEKKESALSEYRARLAAIEPGDVNAFAELARYAAANGLRAEARLLWSRVVSLDPNNVEGHLYLGHVLVAGRYIEEDEAQRAQGLVRFDGRWMTPGEQDSILRERERRASDDRRLDEARRAARDAEERARRAEREAERARAEAAANSPAAWGYGSTVVIGSPYGGYGGGYGGGCGGYPCTSVPRRPRHPHPAPVATPYPQVKPLRPTSLR